MHMLHKQVSTYIYAVSCMHISTHTHTRMHALMHVRTHMHAHTHMHARTHVCTHVRTHTHAHTRTHAWSHACTYAWIVFYAYIIIMHWISKSIVLICITFMGYHVFLHYLLINKSFHKSFHCRLSRNSISISWEFLFSLLTLEARHGQTLFHTCWTPVMYSMVYTLMTFLCIQFQPCFQSNESSSPM